MKKLSKGLMVSTKSVKHKTKSRTNGQVIITEANVTIINPVLRNVRNLKPVSGGFLCH